MKILLVNAIVTPDGTRLESNHRHDYNSHEDQNGETYFIDGGLDYTRRSRNETPAQDACIYSDDSHEKKRKFFKWGTYGVSGKEPLRWIPLCEMSTEHIEAVLETQQHIREEIKKVFADELTYRKTIPNEHP
jgi:hypothetical protein